MKARILDPQVKVYSSFDANAVAIASLAAGSEVEFSAPKRKAGKLWIPITLSTGQQAYIPGESRLFIIRLATLMSKDVDLHAEPSSGSLIKQQLPRNTRLYIQEVLKKEDGDWVKVSIVNGGEGYISGNTSIRVVQEQTKALGRKNMISGIMWLIAGVIVVFSSGSPATGGSFILLGYGAILFGVVMAIAGFIQVLRAPS
ncbi:MAG: SH3 domain-containing protein [Acidobacteriaceae bacterium]